MFCFDDQLCENVNRTRKCQSSTISCKNYSVDETTTTNRRIKDSRTTASMAIDSGIRFGKPATMTTMRLAISGVLGQIQSGEPLRPLTEMA